MVHQSDRGTSAGQPHMLDFPKDRISPRVGTTGIFLAEELLNDHACLAGNVPFSVGQTGSVDKVKPENLRAKIDFTGEYAVYSQLSRFLMAVLQGS